MKKAVIITCAVVLALWAAVLCAAAIKTSSADIIGGADFPTFSFMLTETLRSPLGIAALALTAAAAVTLAVLGIISLYKKRKRQ